ncbi:hypothetical protein LV89_00840 [Arcicella aurantiaca]|uniref:Uncharacterized protein n=1 Tax=Arcicella aurantiaca TaxID=591202 RepID=A0A316EDL8_9BACT|nr:hypothetical protein [Arcicella aurantiaca]PWK28636.1 hypothetical protein LV89_00840 [Arcicella aurantiaca]
MIKKSFLSSPFVVLIFIVSITMFFSSCKSTKNISSNQAQKQDLSTAKSLVFQVKSLKAIDLEEDLTFADEVTLTYSLTAVDENNKVVQVANGSWGVESMKKGQIALEERFKTIELQIPAKGKVLTSVILTEIEDYKKAQNTVKKINEFGNLGKIPTLFIALGEYETPLAIVFASLQAAGIGLKAVEHFDQDDLLGQNTFDLSVKALSEKQKVFPVKLTFEGEHFKNKFHYELTYELKVREKKSND